MLIIQTNFLRRPSAPRGPPPASVRKENLEVDGCPGQTTEAAPEGGENLVKLHLDPAKVTGQPSVLATRKLTRTEIAQRVFVFPRDLMEKMFPILAELDG